MHKRVTARTRNPRSRPFSANYTISFLISFLLFITTPLSAGCTDRVKEPSVSGTFYPSDPAELKRMVERFLSQAERVKTNGELIALISPHAGYIYSGQVAAYGYKQIDSGIKRVILIGQSHRAHFKGASVYTKGSFRTPLGNAGIDEKLAEKFVNETSDVRFLPEAFEKEHSLEVQLPFLQILLNDFKIVPILIGSPTRQTYEHLVTVLTDVFDKNTLIIASTDLSHFYSYIKANEMDGKIISAIERLSLAETERLLRSKEAELCGSIPVLIAIDVSRRVGANFGRTFRHANSGDVTDDKDRVVGYASIGILKSPFTDEEKKELLVIARDAINEYVIRGKEYEREIENPKFKTDGAVFVTIKKNGSLRGCIGHIYPVIPLYKSIIKNAISACSSDRRFSPISREELKDIDIEISILSPLMALKDVNDLQIGKHGLVIRKGLRSGILLPQVATEFGWDRQTFLEQICAKTGLPRGAWKDADLYMFTAEFIR